MNVFEINNTSTNREILEKELNLINIYLKRQRLYSDPVALGYYLQQTDLDKLISLQKNLTRLVDPDETFESDLTDRLVNGYNSNIAAIKLKIEKIRLQLKKDPIKDPYEYKAKKIWHQSLLDRTPINEFNYNIDAIIAADPSHKIDLEKYKVNYKKAFPIYDYVRSIAGPMPPGYDSKNKKHSMWYKSTSSVYKRLYQNLYNLKDGEQLPEKRTVSMTYQDFWDLINNQEWKCAFTQIPFHEGKTELDAGNKAGLKSSPDRIDSNTGYHLGNVDFILSRINFMKWTNDYEEFTSLCSEIVNYAIPTYGIKLVNVAEMSAALSKPIKDDPDLKL
jgi:hypothetical protein